MKWIKNTIRGQITISTLTGVFALFGMVVAPVLWIENIRVQGKEEHAEISERVVSLEKDIPYIKEDINEIKEDLKDIKRAFNIKDTTK